MAKNIAPIIFPDRNIILRASYPRRFDFPNTSVNESTPQGMNWLGINPEVTIRFCSMGSRHCTDALLAQENATMGTVPRTTFISNLRKAGLWKKEYEDEMKRQNWFFKNLIHVPEMIFIPMNWYEQVPMGPFVSRSNHEPHLQFVLGLGAQWDSKRDPLRIPVNSVTMYMTLLFMSMNYRLLNHTKNDHLGKTIGAPMRKATSIYDTVVKPQGFNATAVRLTKKHMITVLVSNCAETRRGGLPMSFIRELFAFEFAKVTGIPVHPMGRCPKTRVERSGLTESQVVALRKTKGKKSAVEILNDYRFGIVFENYNGLISEKIHNAYLADTIPIYFGATRYQLEEALNVKSFIHCNFPERIADGIWLDHIRRRICFNDLNITSTACILQFEQFILNQFRPYFKICIDDILKMERDTKAYDEMLSEPLAKLKPDGNLTETWDFNVFAEITKVVMTGLGYKEKLL
jgi:hypothetical protein